MKHIIESNVEPSNTNVLWLDGDNNLYNYNKGKWAKIGGSGEGSNSSNNDSPFFLTVKSVEGESKLTDTNIGKFYASMPNVELQCLDDRFNAEFLSNSYGNSNSMCYPDIYIIYGSNTLKVTRLLNIKTTNDTFSFDALVDLGFYSTLFRISVSDSISCKLISVANYYDGNLPINNQVFSDSVVHAIIPLTSGPVVYASSQYGGENTRELLMPLFDINIPQHFFFSVKGKSGTAPRDMVFNFGFADGVIDPRIALRGAEVAKDNSGSTTWDEVVVVYNGRSITTGTLNNTPFTILYG